MDTGRMKKRISLLQLERYKQGEMSPDEKASFEKEYALHEEFQELLEKREQRVAKAKFNPLDEVLQKIVKTQEHKESIWYRLHEFLTFLRRTPQVAFPLFAAIITIPFILLRGTDTEPYSVKGRQFLELQCNRVSLPMLSVSDVMVGDTLSIRYRGAKSLFVQLWYQDDNGGFQPYLQSAQGRACSLGASMQLSTVPQKVVLSDGWREEKLVLLADTNDFTVTAEDLMKGDSLPLLIKQEYSLELVERYR